MYITNKRLATAHLLRAMLGESFVILVTIFAQHVTTKSLNTGQNRLPPTCASTIYCNGEILDTVQKMKIFPDSKTFVDLSLKNSPNKTEEAFKNMLQSSGGNLTRAEVKTFIDQNFIEGKELENWKPSDYRPNPNFLSQIDDEKVKTFAQNVVKIWPKLGRKVLEDVKSNPDQHSMIYVPNGFIIPGGRFHEFYYWDSYWIIDGLLICEMHETAKGMIENFLFMVDKYGFVPNGGRVYYLNRSQPPLLTKMAKDYYDITKNISWISTHIATLDKEVMWWFNHRMTTVSLGSNKYKLAFYHSESLGPRPESYREDISTASIFDDDTKKQQVYNELKSAAESGWDFSTRWFFDKHGGIDANISFIQTSRVIPVDLNSFLYGACMDLAYLYKNLKHSKLEMFWVEKARNLKEAIQEILWDEEDGIWYDYDTKLQTRRKMFAASNLSPLWTKAYDVRSSDQYGSKVSHYLKQEGIDEYKGGIPTTKIHSNEQWDFPNAWPPLQYIIIYGLRSTGNEAAEKLAKNFAKNWIEANMIGFEEKGTLFEKYDAVSPGQYGGGGEYEVQSGFGWTNGIILRLIQSYSDIELSRKGKLKQKKKKNERHH